jgi:hypothetical protein
MGLWCFQRRDARSSKSEVVETLEMVDKRKKTTALLGSARIDVDGNFGKF